MVWDRLLFKKVHIPMDTLSNCWVEKLPQDLASTNQQLGLAASHANSEENFTMSVFRLHWE